MIKNNVYIILLTCFVLFQLSLLQLSVNFRNCLSCNIVHFPCSFLLLMQLPLQMLHPIIGFLFSGFWVTIIIQWNLVRFYDADIALQELQAVTLMLCRMTFHSFGKVVTLNLDNNTAKAYLCNQYVTVCLSLQSSLPYIESIQQAWYYSYSNIHTFLLNVKADYLS